MAKLKIMQAQLLIELSMTDVYYPEKRFKPLKRQIILLI
jgi:hypothetical protein